MAAYGIPAEDIAKVVGVGVVTLRKYCRDELDTGHIEANVRVAQFLFNQATKGTGSSAVTAAIFWLKTRAGWKEPPQQIRHGGDGDAPPINVNSFKAPSLVIVPVAPKEG